MILVRLSGQLRDCTNGAQEVKLRVVEDIGSLVRALDGTFPGIGTRIFNEQEKIRAYVNVFVNSENSIDMEGEKTRLSDGDVVHILPSVAGG